MKAYRVYELCEYGFDDDIEYALKYDRAVTLFNDKVREVVKEVKEDLVKQEDFSKQVHYLRVDDPDDNEVKIISRKMPYILFAEVLFWERTSYEYNEWDIRSMRIVLEEIEIDESEENK